MSIIEIEDAAQFTAFMEQWEDGEEDPFTDDPTDLDELLVPFVNVRPKDRN